jgi:hypothetical protein
MTNVLTSVFGSYSFILLSFFLFIYLFIYLFDFISQKLWAVCDLAMGLLLSKTTNYEMKEFPADTRVPTMYFRRHEDALWVNAKSYLPPDMQVRLTPF